MSEQIVLTVTAIGSTAAVTLAKSEARKRGYRVLTVASCRPVLGQSYTNTGKERLAWEVALAVRPAA